MTVLRDWEGVRAMVPLHEADQVRSDKRIRRTLRPPVSIMLNEGAITQGKERNV